MFDMQDLLDQYVTSPEKNKYPEEFLLYGQPGCGKGLLYGTQVYTPKGPVPVESLEVGDELIGSDGKPTTVYGIWDRGVQPLYHIVFSDGDSITVDGDHLWTVRQRTDRAWFTDNTKSLYAKMLRKHSKNYEVPICAPVQFSPKELPIPPYMLGALIADGYLAGDVIQWTKNNMNVVSAMTSSASRGGWTIRETTCETSTARQWVFTQSAALKSILKDLELNVLSADKHIPPDYLHSTVADRMDLLNGLFDGDGTYRYDRGLAMYATTSYRLASDVVNLCWSLGIPSRMSHKRASDGTYKVTLYTGFNPFKHCEWAGMSFDGNHRLSGRQMVSIEPVGMGRTRCLAVTAPDQLFVAENYIVTHNTHMAASAININTPDLKFNKGLFIDTEGSTVGVVKDPRIDIIRVDKYEHMGDDGKPNPHSKFLFLDALLNDGPKGLFNPNNVTDYDFIAIDTLDVAQDLAIDWYQSGNDSSVFNERGKIDGWAIWAKVAEWTIDIARGLKKIDPLGILVLHDREEKLDSGAMTKRLRLGGKSKDVLPGIPDVVAYLERKKGDDGAITTTYFSTEDNKVTKNRWDEYIPPVVQAVDIPDFYNMIYKGWAEE